MMDVLIWLVIFLMVGWAAAPLAFRLFPKLADRGFFFSKTLGLLLLAFSFWLLVITGILHNDAGGILITFGMLLILSALTLRKGGLREWLDWLSGHKGLVASGEILFLAAFLLMALLRAANPDIVGTEKPMEMAFINSILRSPAFPPHDPWLSGYAISYYYFGYVMSAVLIKISGADSGVGFNLSIAAWFALSTLGGYGVLYSLIHTFRNQQAGDLSPKKGHLAGFFGPLLAPLFMLILGNLEGLLEMLHAAGLFWQKAGERWTSGFWQYLNVAELTEPPALPLSLVPNRPAGIWWWRASRVLQDFDLQGNVREIIDEFPFFSYLLADLHPHVLSVPFALLAVAFALNFYLAYQGRPAPVTGLFSWFNHIMIGKPASGISVGQTFLATLDFWLGALIFGGLSFLNTWDFPIYVGLFCLVFILVKVQFAGWRWGLIVEFIETGLALGLAGVLLYLPFYIGFASQAGGLLPSLAFFTRGVYFWLMFGVMLVPIFFWLLSGAGARRTRPDWVFGIKTGAGLVFGLWLVSYGLSFLLSGLVGWAGLAASGGNPLAARVVELSGLFAGIQGGSLNANLLASSLLQRLASPGTWLTLLALFTVVFASLNSLVGRQPGGEGKGKNPAAPFVLILILVGAGLTLVPEFFYLRDQFGWRMNTIFKFYFETWILWSLAAAYATVQLWRTAKSAWHWIGCALGVLLIAGGLIYPVFGIRAKTNNFNPGRLTLDGNAYRRLFAEGEMAAIEFLRQAPLGVVAEAVGGSYSSFARVSMLSGQPTVLGWPGHESQWRGGSREIGSREQDIERLYRTGGWEEALEVIRRYRIKYIFAGGLEESTYRVNHGKFESRLPVIFKNDQTVIYEVPDSLLEMSGK